MARNANWCWTSVWRLLAGMVRATQATAILAVGPLHWPNEANVAISLSKNGQTKRKMNKKT